MDPKACLLNAEISIKHGAQEGAEIHLDNYINWRGTGGFQPIMDDSHHFIRDGDLFFELLVAKYKEKFGEYLGASLPE